MLMLPVWKHQSQTLANLLTSHVSFFSVQSSGRSIDAHSDPKIYEYFSPRCCSWVSGVRRSAASSLQRYLLSSLCLHQSDCCVCVYVCARDHSTGVDTCVHKMFLFLVFLFGEVVLVRNRDPATRNPAKQSQSKRHSAARTRTTDVLRISTHRG